MSDPTKAPAGWYEDGSGGRRYWDGDAWTQYTAPGASVAPGASAAPADGIPTEAFDTGSPSTPDGATIPYVWGSASSSQPTSSYGEGIPAASGYGDSTTVPDGWSDPTATATYGAADPGADTADTVAFGRQPTTVIPAEHPFTEPSNPGPNVVGIIALVLAVVGFVFACIPDVMGVAWILLPIAFVLSIVGMFLRGAKWPAVTGLIVTIVATIVGIAVFVSLVMSSLDDVFDEIDDVIPEVPILPQPGEDVPGEGPDQQAPVGNLAFGETMTWDDGVALTVSVPEPYTPSDFAVGTTQADDVVFTLTITNNSTENLQPIPLPTLSSGGEDASQIFDIGADVEGNSDDVGIPPTALIPPGGSVTWRAAWSVADPSSLTMQASPSFLYPDAVFTNVP